MADNTPNEKDIRDAQERLADYNQALRDSVNIAKELSKQVSKLPESLRFSEAANKNLINTTKDYEAALARTIKFSEKAKTGKIKESELQDQLNDLTKKYSTYLEQNEASFKETGRFLLKQKSLQEDISKLQTEEVKKGKEITKQHERFNTLQKKLDKATRDYYNANNPTQKKQAADRMKAAREEIKDVSTTLNFLEKAQAQNQKNIAQKKEEKEQIRAILKNHKDLLKSYEQEIEDNEILLEQLKEKNSLEGQTKNEVEQIGDKIKNSIKSTFSLVAIFEYLKKVAFGASEQVTKLQKGLVLSREEAYAVRQEFNNIAVAADDAAINTNRLIEANAALGKQLGFNSKFTDDLNIQFVKLTKQIGISEEAAGGLAKLSVATGKTLEESKNIALGTAQALSAQYGIQLDQREVLEEVGKISGQTLAMFKGSVPALAQAVAQAKLLGTNLDNAKKQASSLLNFETSIENELQAELLTGQQLNLERARTAALTGDLTTVMKELNNQNIDFNKFSNMNVIAQDKIAAALGLSSDELSDQLLKQQYMGKSTEEVAALAGEEVAKRLEALSAQDKFNLAMERMQDIFSKLVGGGLGQLVDMMANIANNAGVLYGLLGAMAGISLVKTVMGIALMATQLRAAAMGAAATSAFLNPVNIALGIAALAGAAYLIGSYMSDDTPELADGGLAYGKTNAIVGEYPGAANNPEVIAPLSDLQNIISNSNRQTAAAQDNSETISLLTDMRNEMRATRENTGKFVDKEFVAKYDSQRAGTITMMGNTNFA